VIRFLCHSPIGWNFVLAIFPLHTKTMTSVSTQSFGFALPPYLTSRWSPPPTTPLSFLSFGPSFGLFQLELAFFSLSPPSHSSFFYRSRFVVFLCLFIIFNPPNLPARLPPSFKAYLPYATSHLFWVMCDGSKSGRLLVFKVPPIGAPFFSLLSL